jgi:hypothetical protein
MFSGGSQALCVILYPLQELNSSIIIQYFNKNLYNCIQTYVYDGKPINN